MITMMWIVITLCRDWVILRPSWLSDIIKPLFRPEFGDSSSTEDSLKQLGISHQRFDRMKKGMLEEGELRTPVRKPCASCRAS